MQRLLLDLGNSRLKAGWQAAGELHILTVDHADQIHARIPDLPDQIWLSSVADQDKTQSLLGELDNLAEVHQVKVPDYQHHLPTQYVPEQLGVDRWLAMLACQQISPGPCLVVDCGTAVTLDWVDAKGEHQGGYILPGLHLMQNAVLQGTAIDWVEPGAPIQSFALDSASAIALGARQALGALIDRMLNQVAPDSALFISGGDAGELVPYLASSHREIQHIVLNGLAYLADLEVK